MEFEELVREYLRLFVLVMECAGDITNNKYYKNVATYIEKREEQIKELIEDEPPFEIVVHFLIVILLSEIHGCENLYGRECADKLRDLSSDMYDRYLKTNTNKFLRKNGLPIISKLDENYLAILLPKKEK